MAELRIILLGESWSEKSLIANLILGFPAFDTKVQPNYSRKAQKRILKTNVVLINTPDLLYPKIPEEKLKEHVEQCVTLSDPGPHLFLLVVQPKSFMEEQKRKLCQILMLFSDRAFDHSLVLISKSKQKDPSSNKYLQDMIKRCKFNSLIFEEN